MGCQAFDGGIGVEGELNPEIHHPTRIAILSRLISLGSVRFTRLRQLTGLTPGNLSSHLAALERAGYVKTRSALFGSGPGTVAEVTSDGAQAFRAYVSRLEALVAELTKVRDGSA